ncbi:hypothetical protein NO348_17090 [Hungatella hathewayi]|uniref:hypothetical protein n=1 Tax=Hungatella hathewayi TaxID=154046 RepID=UPI0021094DF7|nr:hypothetical protein [Hungatella hathewayi]MCQ5386540.1 hypothetical protein [Hungatella hathewayi]
MNFSLKIKPLPVLVTATMVITFMSGYSIFYGSVGSPLWYLLYYGKYFLILFFVVISYSFHEPDKRFRKTRTWLYKLFLTLPLALLFYSFIVWLIRGSSVEFVSRGISSTLFRCIAYMGGISIAYMFKKAALKYGIYAAIITYSASVVLGLLKGGATFLKINLMNRTTSIQGLYTELHEVAFTIGLYLVFLFFINKRQYISKTSLLTMLCITYFIIGWKRIGIAGIIIVFLYGLFIHGRKNWTKSEVTKITGIVAIIACLFYVSLSTSNELVAILQLRGINLMGRNIIYNYFRQFCDFHINYFGRGVGFVTRQFDYATAADLYNMISIKALHNDLMKMFIDIGFISYIFWCWYWLREVPQKIEKKIGTEAAFECFLLIMFSFITYTTDNTEGYFNFQLHLSMIMSVIIYNHIYINCEKITTKNNLEARIVVD